MIGLGGEIVLVKVRAETAEGSYEAAVALIETFTEQILRPQRETVRASAAFFQEQLDALRGKPESIEPEVARMPEARAGTLQGKLSIRKALAEAEVRLVAAEREVEDSETKLRKGSPGGRQLRKHLSDARAELYELNHVYGSNHPKLVAAKRRVRSLQQALRREQNAEKALASESADSAPGAQGQQANAAPTAGEKHQALLVELKEAGAEVELLRHSLLTEELSMFTDGNQVWTVEPPVMPTRSQSPPLFVVLAAALLAGLVLSLLAVAVFAAFDDTLRGEKELAQALGAPSLGRMPRGEA